MRDHPVSPWMGFPSWWVTPQRRCGNSPRWDWGSEPPQKEPLGSESPWIHQSRDCRAGEALPHPIKSIRGSIQEFPESGSGA